ncbi:hypothetical protein PTTG_26875 [Puccinia triticina 1-1 BBBD Race 1]|uniref:Secreted protein n=2 Tax=Puccinia triticina TaxID=208348 RepID=A0A180GPM8_PUCT1|nr:uncharacterized protein PtA15_7A409 [Puccinia triticina]OAV94777.1 hypothetical protein PTTG_26875 [Puccinia triticina 1-1 BBBD Race 1]WAQ86681.1 hypothetical protein PtA15_7A409 [Puccinia triticina]WAR56548.1 hypothetical protein PtB15_7B397 [Puccinia triticina]
MASIRFITLILALSFASNVWTFQCNNANGKTNGVCVSRNGNGAPTAAQNNEGNLTCNNQADQTFCCAKQANQITRQNLNNECTPSEQAGGQQQGGTGTGGGKPKPKRRPTSARAEQREQTRRPRPN